LNAERCLDGPSQERPVEGTRRVSAGRKTIIVLMELVALERIGQEIGEVVEKIERAVDEVEIGLPRAIRICLRRPR
jgi:hypothetical protein